MPLRLRAYMIFFTDYAILKVVSKHERRFIWDLYQ